MRTAVLVTLAAALLGAGCVDNRIVVSGNIELTEVNIAFKTAGRLIERTVDEGDRGQGLVELAAAGCNKHLGAVDGELHGVRPFARCAALGRDRR